MSRKVVVYIATSIDGYIADSQGGIDWLDSGEVGTEVDTHYESFYEQVDTVILGRTTYDQIVLELSPNDYPYKGVQSYVMTSKKAAEQEGILFTDESVVSLVNRLKKESGKTIWIVGGNQVIMPLVKEQLIDEYQIATIPIILGKGIPLFSSFESPVPLATKNVTTRNGIVYHTFVRK